MYGGGVDYPGSWFVGEGLEVGNNFSYHLCHIFESFECFFSMFNR